jgi:hypothetical protein
MPPIPLQELEKITKKNKNNCKKYKSNKKWINKTKAPLPSPPSNKIKVDCPAPKTQPDLEKEIKNLSPHLPPPASALFLQ